MSTDFRTVAETKSGLLPYEVPVLVQFGSVRELTQGGSVGPGETPGNCANTTKTAPCPGSPSEPALKENIVRVGDDPRGFGIYLFDYRPEFKAEFGSGRQFGVMADEVEAVAPDAVSFDPRGFRVVHYDRLGIQRITH